MCPTLFTPGLRLALAHVLTALLLSIAAPSPAVAWNLSCSQLCDAVKPIQSYGTGVDDASCHAVCVDPGADCSNAKGTNLWNSYFTCVDAGWPLETCWPRYVDAKECSVCDQGEVSPFRLEEVLFVNRPACDPNGVRDGSLGRPFCDFTAGIDAAIDLQTQERDATILVCEGTYREGWDETKARNVSAPGSAKVLVQAVTRDSAVISGSTLWQGTWLPETTVVAEDFHNELLRSSSLDHAVWSKFNVNVLPQWIYDPPTIAVVQNQTTQVHRVEASLDASALTGMVLAQEIPVLQDRLVTFSVYIRPDQAHEFRMDLRLQQADGVEKTGASYSFQLPPDPACNRFTHSSGAYDIALQGKCGQDETHETCQFPLINSAVALINSKGLTLRENRFDWNAAYGVAIGGLAPNPGNDILLWRNAANDNGIGGEYFSTARGFQVLEDEFSRNNWRGREVGVSGHAAGGAKYSTLWGGDIAYIVAEDNYGSGLWFDYENQAVLVKNATLANNHGAGLYFEANDAWTKEAEEPTTTVTACTITGNRKGILGISSSSIVVDNNVLIGNVTGLALNGTPRVEKAPKPMKYLYDWTITNNEIRSTCARHEWFQYGDMAAGWGDWTPVMLSLELNSNDYAHPFGIAAEGFRLKTEVPIDLPTWSGCTSEPWCILPQDGLSGIVP